MNGKVWKFEYERVQKEEEKMYNIARIEMLKSKIHMLDLGDRFIVIPL